MTKEFNQIIILLDEVIKTEKLENNIQKLKTIRNNLFTIIAPKYSLFFEDENENEYLDFIEITSKKIISNPEIFEDLQNLLLKIAKN